MTPDQLLDDLRRYTAAVADSIAPAPPSVVTRPASTRRRVRLVASAAALASVALGAALMLSRDGPATSVDARDPDLSSTDATTDEPDTSLGSPVARLRIDAIELDYIVVEGAGREQLKLGPAHESETPLPGYPGNSVILGHRTTYGAVFNRLDELMPGDLIEATTADGEFTYVVREARVIDSGALVEVDGDYWADVSRGGFANALTLVAPHPEYASSQRLVVGAELVGRPVVG